MAKIKKILYLVTQSEWGGAQKYIFDLATNLPENFDVLVATGEGNDELLSKLQDKNIKTIKLKYLKRAINPFFDILAFFEIKKLLKNERPDVIHLNSSKISILGSLVAKSIFNPPSLIIYTAHGWVFNEPLPFWKKNLYLKLERYTAKFKNKIICVSEFDKQVALDNKICLENKLVTIHNGINVNNLQFFDKNEARQKLNKGYEISDKEYVIGTIANLYKTKGLNYLIEAANEIVKQISDIQFVIIGEGPEEQYLKLKIKNSELKNSIIMTGKIDEAHKYLKAFDIFILPSIKEGLPYTLLEAITAKLPIIATKVGGIPEIIEDQTNGLLVEPANPQKLANAIIKLLNDNSLKQLLISNINLDKFSLQQMIDKTLVLY